MAYIFNNISAGCPMQMDSNIWNTALANFMKLGQKKKKNWLVIIRASN